MPDDYLEKPEKEEKKLEESPVEKLLEQYRSSKKKKSCIDEFLDYAKRYFDEEE